MGVRDGGPGAQVFTALALEAERRVGDFNPVELANLALAFAKAGLSDAQLFTALAKEAERRAGDFNPVELVNLAWAFATASVHGVHRFTAFATAGLADAQLFTMLAREAEVRVREFNSQELAPAPQTTAYRAGSPAALNPDGLVPPVALNPDGLVPVVALNPDGLVPPVALNPDGLVPPVAPYPDDIASCRVKHHQDNHRFL